VNLRGNQKRSSRSPVIPLTDRARLLPIALRHARSVFWRLCWAHRDASPSASKVTRWRRAQFRPFSGVGSRQTVTSSQPLRPRMGRSKQEIAGNSHVMLGWSEARRHGTVKRRRSANSDRPTGEHTVTSVLAHELLEPGQPLQVALTGPHTPPAAYLTGRTIARSTSGPQCSAWLVLAGRGSSASTSCARR